MYRKIPPERLYLLVASGGEGRMGESYLPHSAQHEKVLTLRKLFVHLVHRPKVKSQESYRPVKTQGLCDPCNRCARFEKSLRNTGFYFSDAPFLCTFLKAFSTYDRLHVNTLLASLTLSLS